MSASRIVEIHCSEAAFLWRLRERAARDAAYDLGSLGELDARVDAHLDGLVIAGAAGVAACRASLDEPEPGSVFAALFVAVRCRGEASLSQACRSGAAVGDVLALALSSPALLREATAALAWLQRPDVDWLLPSLLDDSGTAPRRQLGIAAAAARRHDPGEPLARAAEASEASLRGRALRAVGELGRTDISVAHSYDAADPAVRYWALWAGALRGDPRAVELLWAVVRSDSPFAERACATVMRTAEASTARRWLEALSPATDARKALIGAAALGDPALVPWALELSAKPELTRLAAEAVRRIAGIDCESRLLRSKPPAGFRSGPTDDPADDDVEIDPDDSLPWPNAPAVAAHWLAVQGDFSAGTRYSWGKPIATTGWLEHLLRHGRQPVRAAAAEELALRVGRSALFEVRARGARQQRELVRG